MAEMMKIMSVASLVYLYLCFLSSIHALFHIIFIGTETPQYERKIIEGPFECKLVFFAKVVNVHLKLKNNASE